MGAGGRDQASVMGQVGNNALELESPTLDHLSQ